MFTGIVEEVGVVRAHDGGRLEVACRTVPADVGIGASVAVSGACLTVVEREDDCLAFDLSEETLARTALGRVRPGDGVNLERPVTLATRLGGHLVQGHVDGVGEVESLDAQGDLATLDVRVPVELTRYVADKGSIALDGVSLTIASVQGRSVRIALIPHTLRATTLGSLGPDDPVNVEVDVIAKYVDRLREATS
jgi:riboflavin synthase